MSLIQRMKSILSTADLSPLMQPRDYQRKRHIIDDALIDRCIAEDAPHELMVQIMWVDIRAGDDKEAIDACWAPHSRTLREYNAVQRYIDEVGNGGHEQFFTNSSGLHWQEALDGLQRFGLHNHRAILVRAIDLLGGNLPTDRDEMWARLEERNVVFHDLDKELWRSEPRYQSAVMTYAKTHREEFYFDAVLEEPV
jgi:hypothetical protein